MANNSGFQIVQLIGTGVVAAAIISWVVPKFSKPPVVAVPAAVPHPAAAQIATSPSAQMLSGGIPRDYNLSGLAIEDIDGYPTSSGVGLSGI